MRTLRAKFLIALVIVAAPAFASPASSGDDLLPWPWGVECPFPWSKIQGEWIERQDHPDRFTFEVKGNWRRVGRYLDVRRYNEKDELIGFGKGIPRKREKMVRVAMVGVGPAEGQAYWAIVRAYTAEEEKLSCSRAKKVVVITLRYNDRAKHQDEHLIIDKETSESPSWREAVQ